MGLKPAAIRAGYDIARMSANRTKVGLKLDSVCDEAERVTGVLIEPRWD